MPHADSTLLSPNIQSKAEFWGHVYTQLGCLLEGQRNWVTNLANASSLIYHCLRAFIPDDKAVNWCGFYLDSSLFPSPTVQTSSVDSPRHDPTRLLLGPFCGKPACQFINTLPGKARGVCADSFLQRKSLLVPNVDAYPGHIACDDQTKSEIVCPLILQTRRGEVVLGVLDLDCVVEDGFDEEDRVGLERIAKMIVDACDW